MLTITSFRIYFSALLLLAAVTTAFSQQRYSPDKPHRDAMPGRIVMKLKPQYRQQATDALPLQKALAPLGVTSAARKFPQAEIPLEQNRGHVDLTLVYEIEYAAAVSPEKAAAALEATNTVEYAEPLYRHYNMYQPNDPLADSVSGSQYHLRKIRAFEAWNIEKGDTNVVVGVIDTGVKYDHPDLMGNIKY
ncbi:MAG: hypothetical protein EOP49_48780, partial [Sphingobacteriales bacterium]